MTKKDYVLIAGVIKQSLKELGFIPEYQTMIGNVFIDNFSRELKHDNLNFDREKFEKFIQES